ncbi:MAG: hypothetical protein LBH85_01600 [Treponema sp.]|jgi:hypothetical protein|nr:hypothetical protein [Treponema sp.]
MRIGAVFSVSGDTPDFAAISNRFGMAAYRLLAHVGMKAARSLYEDELINVLHPKSYSSTGAPLSERGRRMVSYSVDGSRKSVIVRSFPMNVYRLGEGKRTEKRWIGEKVFRSFAKSFDADSAARDALDAILSPEYQAAGSSKTGPWETLLRKNRPVV